MRAFILEKIYEWSVAPYRLLKRNAAWDIDLSRLLAYPKNSLGHEMGKFLQAHHFTLQQQLESHDVFHVLTQTGTSVPEEIGMQFFLLGNGKRSPYLFTVILLGTFFYPDYLRFFHRQYVRGKVALRFHQLDFYKMLDQPLEKIQSTFQIK